MVVPLPELVPERVLIVLAWMVIYRYSIIAAVIMSVVALVIPPFAAIVGNASPANRQ